MKIILTGATGFIGEHVLSFARLHPAITSILVLSRRNLSMMHPKVKVIIQKDFLNYSDEILEACTGAEACIWSLGVARSLSPEDNRKINLDYTLAAAETFARVLGSKLEDGRKFRFVYLSGMMTERDQTKKNLWFMAEARLIRGEVENKLIELQRQLPEQLASYVVRPGGVLATNSLFPSLLEPLARAITVDDLAAKMLDTAINGHRTQIIELDVLRDEGKTLKKRLLKGKKSPTE
ncbi:MAG: hypothetical protein LQ350_008098 [Teloschistes chrysophthalmus]|nr:MAG: hypothetical protein LQ350_008098 [Niorma chrysophthalma]